MTSLQDMLEQLSPEQRELFKMLLQEKREQPRPAQHGIARRDDQAAFPLSFGQQRLWFIHQWEPESPAYNLPQAVHLRGRLDVAILERSLSEIVRRHEALRSRFESHDGQPVQLIDPAGALPIPVEQVGGGQPDERMAAVQRRLIEEARRPFDLEHGPLLRARLFRLGADEHVMLLVMHHIISDGWSNGVLVRELGALYRAFAAGQPAPLAELPLQYADYAAWQRGWLQGETLDQQLDYWRNQLAGAPPVLALPTDRPRPPVQRYGGAVHPLRLPAPLTEALKALGQREGASLFMTLMAAFQVLLYRHSGQEDILVGTPIANRNRSEIEGLIGFFVNTLVLRADLSGGPSFRALLAQVRQTTLAMQDVQDLPFERLVEDLHLERATSYAPLFQVCMALQNAPLPELTAPGLTLTPMEIDDGTAQFDLYLELYEAADGLRGRLKYNTDLFEPGTIARMAEQFQTLLAGIVADPDMAIERLPLLTSDQRQQMLDRHRRTAPFPADRTLHGWFAKQAARTPDRTALTDGDVSLSYRELDRRSNQLAHYLLARGVEPGALVGLCVERSAAVVVGILGILKAGCTYVPLDPAYPAERLAFMLRDSQARALIVQTAGGETSLLPEEIPLATVALDRDGGAITQQPDSTPAELATPAGLAYVIYTSGSTGTPKGCLVSHANVVRLFSATEHWYGFDEHDVWTLFHSYTFDFSVWEIWGALLYGGRLVVVPYHTSRSPEAFYDLLAREGVTVLNQTPSAFRQLSAVDEGRSPRADLALRYVIFGGEALEFASLRGWFARRGDQRPQLVNMYGITETTVHVTYRPILQRDVEQDTGSLIGVPIPDLELYILDSHGAPVPVGVPGELYVGGAGVAQGYLNRPELTEARFIANPFGVGGAGGWGLGAGEENQELGSDNSKLKTQNSKLYRTGDCARYLASGDIEYLGRLDQQVKIRGFRIELSEIEAALARCEGVQAAVVEAREHLPGDTRLVAYVVPAAAVAPAAAELRAALLQQLPDYMVPSIFITLAALPLTSSGKVDRRALPAPSSLRPELSAPFVLPRTPVEMELSLIWADVLRLNSVGVEDNFFDLGGHSLLATQVMARVCKTFAIHLPLRTLFDHPTVARLALEVEQERAGRNGEAPPPIVPVPREGALPLSYPQEQLWLIDQIATGNVAYVIPAMARLRGPLDHGILRRCFDTLMERHEIFRTTYSLTQDGPAQHIHPAGPAPFELRDMRGHADPEQEAYDQALALSMRPVDLERGPVARVVLFQLGDDHHALLLLMHHILMDRWSSDVLLQEMRELYLAFSHGRAPALPKLPVQYADFAHWQRTAFQDAALAHELAYWSQKLAGAPDLIDLPTDRPRLPAQTFRGRYQLLELPAGLTEQLRALSIRSGTTVFMTLLAAFNVLLYRSTGQTDLVVGTPIANRNRLDIERLIGYFLNTLLIRSDLSGNPTFLALLEQTRATCLEAYAHQDLYFERLVQHLRPQRSSNSNPLFNVMFVFNPNYPMADVTAGDLTASYMYLSREVARFDLTMYYFDSPKGCALQVNYNTDLFEQGSMDRLLEHYLTLLEEVVRDPARSIKALPIMRDWEREFITRVLHTNAAAPVDVLPLLSMFDQQVAARPHDPAAEFGGEQLSYAELDRRAERLARHLRHLGVGPAQRVGLFTQRSLDMLVGVLGIIKAGGAYVPLDPAYPAARLELMLADSGAPVLLTSTALRDQAPAGAPQTVCLDTDYDAATRVLPALPRPAILAEQLAYIIYTSGSTGRPKGVAMTHGPLENLIAWQLRHSRLAAGAKTLQFSPLSFDVSFQEIFATLCAGGTLVLMPEQARRNTLELIDLISSRAVERLFLPYVALQQLADTVENGAEPPASLREVITAGEQLRVTPAIAGLFARLDGCTLYNQYGPTESHVVTMLTLDGPVDTWPALPSIGTPISQTQIFILDPDGAPTPIGVPGELYIGGAGLARGYLGRPELTAERFVPNPFGERLEARDLRLGEEQQVQASSLKPLASRLYKTGDRARYLADGTIEFLGRMDQQVKVRGFRIELGEVEAALTQHQHIRESAVVTLPDASGRHRLVAYVQPAPGQLLAVDELRAFLGRLLPDYMVPATFVMLERFPLTPSGKIDRRSLPEPDGGRPELEQEYVAPRNATEQTLARVWAELIGLDRVGVHDNFFAIGGDSLLSLRVIASARQAGIALTPRQVFEHQTVAALAATLGDAPAVQIDQGIVTGPMLLTPAQNWLLDCGRAEVERTFWNVVRLFDVPPGLDHDALATVTARLLLHHDALRARFVETESGWETFIAPPDDRVPFAAVDLSAVPDSELSATIEREGIAIQSMINLAEGPLMLVMYMDCGASRPGRLLVVVHHMVMDALSMWVLLDDLLHGYQQLESGSELRLPPKTTPFPVWSAHLHAYAQSPELRAAYEAWIRLPWNAIPPVPRDHPVPFEAATVESLREITVGLSCEETQQLTRILPVRYQAQVVDALLAALLSSLIQWSPERWFGVTMMEGGRDPLPGAEEMDLSRTVSWFSKAIHLILERPADSAPEAVLAAAMRQRQGHNGLNHGLYYYLGDDPAIKASLEGLPDYEIFFNYGGQMPSMKSTMEVRPSVENCSMQGTVERAGYVIECLPIIINGQILVGWKYSERLHDRATIERLGEHYLQVLRALIAGAAAV
ncbi:MAG TPA: amino acid adenylation domain-containing protein [Roseiflexaceae bacterium]|nr:amino acid adenylation domain-containing protein [Roseiflexaceae bacterium]